MKKSIKNCILGVFIGLLFIGFGIGYLATTRDLRENGIETQATITDIVADVDYDEDDVDYTVYVEYTVDGKEYSGELNSYSSTWKRGDKVTILYLPSNPAKIIDAKSNSAVIVIAFILGGLVIVLNVAYIAFVAYRNVKKTQCIKEENKVETSIMQFEAGKLRLFGARLATIVCMDSENNIYENKFLCEDINRYKVGGKIDVYVDRQTKKYYINV